jgi:hypothetical protein
LETYDYCVRLIVQESNYSQNQKLFCIDRVDYAARFASVIFAGDLDRDGVPDLILGGSDHYNLGATHLFLSSPPKNHAEGGWLKKVADFRTTGC